MGVCRRGYDPHVRTARSEDPHPRTARSKDPNLRTTQSKDRFLRTAQSKDRSLRTAPFDDPHPRTAQPKDPDLRTRRDPAPHAGIPSSSVSTSASYGIAAEHSSREATIPPAALANATARSAGQPDSNP